MPWNTSRRFFIIASLYSGTSVFGVKYKDGVVLGADTLGSYGSLARFPNVERVIKINDNTVVACSGDYADFQVEFHK